MKFHFKEFVLGVLVGTIGLTTVFAEPIKKQLEAVYSINAVTVDGKTIQFEDDSQPFVISGRTYLPVRGVAEALDKNVTFDSDTSTVVITSKKESSPAPTPSDTYVGNLTKDMVTGYDDGILLGIINNWDIAELDNAGKTHETGIEFITNLYDADFNDSWVYPKEASLHIGLLGEYTKFKGQLVQKKASKSISNSYTVSILADGKEIESFDNVTFGTVPIVLDLNVTGVRQLTFTFTTTSSNVLAEKVTYGIVDVSLYE